MKITLPVSTRPNAFVRACYAIAQSRVNNAEPESFVRKDDVATRQVLERADATIGKTTTAGWGAELLQDAFPGFLRDLAPYSVAARLIAQAVPARVGAYDEYKYPVRSTGPTAPGWVGEGDAIPVRSNTFALVTIGPARKMAHIFSWSRELGKRSDAETIFAQMLREDVAAGLDAAFLATSAGSTSAPAGLLYGLTAGTGYGGGDREAIEADLISLSDAVSAAGSGNVTFIMAPARLGRLRIKAPELLAAIDVAPSAAVPASRIVAADAASLLVAVDAEPEIYKTEAGTLHMSDSPAEIVAANGTVADPVRELWQTATAAVRVIHEIDFKTRRTGAVAYLDGATW